MINITIVNIVAAIIAALFVAVLSVILKRYAWEYVNMNMLLYSSRKHVKYIFKDYKSALEIIKNEIESKKGTELKMMLFMGKDLTLERGLLYSINTFLNNGGKLRLLIIDPRSLYVVQRANELDIDVETLKFYIYSTILNINSEFRHKYPNSVQLRIHNNMPLFRIIFINNYLFLGFYMNIKSYENVFYQLTDNSQIYKAMEKFFDLTWEGGFDA